MSEEVRPIRAGSMGPLFLMLWHTTLVLLLLTTGYYLLPLRVDIGSGPFLLRASVSLAAFVGLAVALRRQYRRSRSQLPVQYVRIQWLLTTLYLLILSFSLTYAVVAFAARDQFVGIANRTDALYFAVTVMGTVGFGDIHAAGTFARILVTVQMLFNLVYLGTALRVISSRTTLDG